MKMERSIKKKNFCFRMLALLELKCNNISDPVEMAFLTAMHMAPV